jgi:hypothetical protein
MRALPKLSRLSTLRTETIALLILGMETGRGAGVEPLAGGEAPTLPSAN